MNSLVQLKESRPPPTPLPQGYDVNARYGFHSGAPRHTIENCKSLEHKVQDLIDSKAISFTLNDLNVWDDPTLPHASTSAVS